MTAAEMIGRPFGFLTALSIADARGGKPHILCRCVCGAEKIIRARNLRDGNTKSCGCKSRELVSAAKKGRARPNW